jgi:hypothetical protein
MECPVFRDSKRSIHQFVVADRDEKMVVSVALRSAESRTDIESEFLTEPTLFFEESVVGKCL